MSKFKELISTPKDKARVEYRNERLGYGLFEIKGKRDTQEDAAAARWYTETIFAALTPEEIGRRLWTTYKLLNLACLKPAFGGSTASTTVYDGKGNLITATLGDSLAFLVWYEEGKEPVVTRLNQVTHHPEEDKQRFIDAGGTIVHGRVKGEDHHSLSMARAMGDWDYSTCGVCDDAHINITNIAGKNGILQLITTCDGFTEPLSEQTKIAHEEWLRTCLKSLGRVKHCSELDIATRLVMDAAAANSHDNISVAVQTIFASKPFLIGIYDGHAGANTSSYIAKNIGNVFDKQCQLSAAEYAQHYLSAYRQSRIYCRDNTDADLFAYYQKEQMIRATELRALAEPLACLKAQRVALVLAVAQNNEKEIQAPSIYLAVLEQLIPFFKIMHYHYMELSIDKQELINCMKYVLNCESAFVFEKAKLSFLDLDFKELKNAAALFKTQKSLKDLLTHLLQAYSAIDEPKPAISSSPHRLFRRVVSGGAKGDCDTERRPLAP